MTPEAAAPGREPAEPSPRMPELDGLRGAAILLVLIWHFWAGLAQPATGSIAALLAWPFHFAWSGVDLFFVLSGFLIGGILIDQRSATNYFRIFYFRRACRILPLYYTIHNDRIIFASEIKSIFMASEIQREIDPMAIDQIFTFWTTLPGRTLFRNVYEIPPGHYLTVSERKIDLRKY